MLHGSVLLAIGRLVILSSVSHRGSEYTRRERSLDPYLSTCREEILSKPTHCGIRLASALFSKD